MTEYAKPPYPAQQQEPPGHTKEMKPLPDHGARSYKGSGRLKGKTCGTGETGDLSLKMLLLALLRPYPLDRLRRAARRLRHHRRERRQRGARRICSVLQAAQ